MTNNFNYNRLVFHTLLLILSICALAFCIAYQKWHGLLLIFLIIYQCLHLISMNKRILSEFQDFVEAVRYRDFSRRFYNKKSPSYILQMHQGFNEVCDTITAINREKELQYQYLQKIIEMVDTGILSYQIDTGEVLWMNRSLKNLLEIPTLKNFNYLQQRNESLFEALKSLNHGSSIISINKENGLSKILIASGTFIMQETKYRLLAFQNVNEALDEAEAQAWQRLLNVMTHEIMNSVAPISSLANTLKKMLENAKEKDVITSDSVFEDIQLGIDTIMRRSQGLLSFAETYRNLGKITELNISNVQVSTLFEHISQLMLPTLIHKNIELEVILKDDPLMRINADSSLIEQIMINLILNAIEAVKENPNPRITLTAALTSSKRSVIKVIDNGVGIPDELLDKIFIPFFSTRKNGNGIGLSLCKQIMMLHRGNIQVQTIAGEGSCFNLLF